MENPTTTKILLIDDNKALRETLTSNLRELGYQVFDFRDSKTFEEAFESKGLLKDEGNYKLLVMLDIMFAEELGEDKEEAPIFEDEEPDIKKLRDDELGLKLAQKIRKGDYVKYNLPKDVAILFFTCRQSNSVLEKIESLDARFILKPQPLSIIDFEIEKTLNNQIHK
jgi:CheY-like chemotaxis protein